MANAPITTQTGVIAVLGSPLSATTRPRLGERRFLPLAPHDLLRHVAGDAVGDIGDVVCAEQRAAAALAVAHEEIGARGIVDRGIGEEIDPQPRRAARHEHEIEAVIMLGKFDEYGFELGLQELEPGDLAVAPVGGAVEAFGLVHARLADGLAQRPRSGRARQVFHALIHPRDPLALGLSITR